MQYYDKKAVGRRIKQLRKSKGLTQHGLAGLLDYTGIRQLQRIETGETSCTVEKLMEIAQVLETSTDFLLFGQERDSKEQYYKVFEGKNSSQKQYLLAVLEAAAGNLTFLE